MSASQDLQSAVGASRVTGFGRVRLGAAVLAAVGAGVGAQPTPAQTPQMPPMPPPITIPNMGGMPATVTVPDPFAVVEQALGCASMACLDDMLQIAAPALEPPRSPSPPSSPSQPEEPAAPPPKDGPRASPSKPADRAAPVARKRPRAPEPASVVRKPALAEVVAAAPAPRPERGSGRPLPPPEVPALSGPELPAPPSPILPAALPGFEWSPLLLNLLLAAGSFAALLFVLVATPRHSLGHVSLWLADRRSDVGLLGTVLLFGLAVGYLIATSLG
jgi:hypothetical protein